MYRRVTIRRMSFLSVLALVGCGGSAGNLVVSNGPAPVLQNEWQVRVLELNDEASIQRLDADGTLVMDSHAPALTGLHVGDVLVASASPTLPNGLLRRVVSINPASGTTILATNAATLEDVFYSAQTAQKLEISADDIAVVENKLDGVEIGTRQDPLNASKTWTLSPIGVDLFQVVVADVDGNPATKTDQLRLSGSFKIEPRFDVAIDIQWGSLKQFSFKNSDKVQAELSLDGSIAVPKFSKTVTLATLRLSPIILQLGPVPVVMVPTATLAVGIEGDVAGSVKSTVKMQSSLSLGVEYLEGKWTFTEELPKSLEALNLDFQAPVLSGAADANAYAQAKASLLFYGVGGPYVTASGTAALKATTANRAWQFSAGVRSDIGIEASIFRKTLKYSTPLLAKQWQFANGTY